MNRENDAKTTQFLKLLGECNRQISAYIFSVVQNFEDANDILQQTIGIMWQKFDEFELGTDFASWGVKIAHFQILSYRRKKSSQKVFFSDNIFQQIDEVAQKRSVQSDERLKYLRQCLKKLVHTDLMLLKNRFEQNLPVKSLAEHTDKSIQHVYRRLAKIQLLLYKCIQRNMAEEEI